MKYALLSVFNKTGIIGLAKTLTSLDYSIISTGGTAKILTENNIEIIPIQEITGNPESFDGRMKTISFQIESGILFDRSNKKHLKEAEALKIKPIDIVICNLYPFEEKQTIENIDIGGPTMMRAAAKNYKDVLVITDPKDYEEITLLLNSNKVTEGIRKQLAAKAFAHLSYYDSQIASYLEDSLFPDKVTIAGKKLMDLRYGENPHQQAAVYLQPHTHSPFRHLEKKAGRDLSLTNLTDINAGIESVKLFDEPAAVVIKHNNPCGIALGTSIEQALKRAIDADEQSAFGGVIVLNQSMSEQAAKVIVSFKDEKKGNIDIVTAPHVDEKAIELLTLLRKSMGIYTFGEVKSSKSKVQSYNYKFIDGGFIAQTSDDYIEEGFKDWKVVTKKKPSDKELEQMKLGWKFISRIKSNAIVIVDKDLPMTRGIGTGQTSRVRATRIAIEQAGSFAKDGILASDSFFPFPDSVELAAKAGIVAIVQQGGSISDQKVINAADEAGIAMVFTNRRAFWH